jgi:hypothetical protein
VLGQGGAGEGGVTPRLAGQEGAVAHPEPVVAEDTPGRIADAFGRIVGHDGAAQDVCGGGAVVQGAQRVARSWFHSCSRQRRRSRNCGCADVATSSRCSDAASDSSPRPTREPIACSLEVDRDIAQDIRESLCESCGDLTVNDTVIDCREWHYRGKVYPAAPLSLLGEAIISAMSNIEAPPVAPAPLADLPENLRRYFANVRPPTRCC